MSDVRLLARGPGFYFASWRQVYILDWRTTASKEGLDASVSSKAQVLRDFPDGVLVFNILDGHAPLPDAQTRAYAEKKQAEDPRGVLCHATVIHGEGFRPSTVRSMLAGLYLVGRSPFPRKVFSGIPEGAAWISTFAKISAGWVEGLLAALDTVRAAPEK